MPLKVEYIRRDEAMERSRLHKRRLRDENYAAGFRVGCEAAYKANVNLLQGSEMFVRGFAAGLHFKGRQLRQKARHARHAYQPPKQ